MNIQEKINEVANEFLGKGYSIIPIGEKKVPAIKWKENKNDPIKEWNFPGCQIGILTGEYNRIAVVDCDSYESYVGWLKHRPKTPLRVRSKRGMHFYYRHPGTYIKNDAHIMAKEGFDYDVRGDGGYTMFPPSMNGYWQYQFCVCEGNLKGEWIEPENLPPFDPEWRPERVHTEWDEVKIRDIRAYAASVHSIEGQGGDKACFAVCMAMKNSGITEMEAMALLMEWNTTNAQPPWPTQDLVRKLKIAYGG